MRNIVNALFVRDGMVLLARRSTHRAAYPGLWSFPGGHVERDETLTDALMREVREEVSVIPTSLSFLTTIVDPNAPDTDPATYHMYVVTAWGAEMSQLFSATSTLNSGGSRWPRRRYYRKHAAWAAGSSVWVD
jgi:8-oxo-dGTP diphosphatase